MRGASRRWIARSCGTLAASSRSSRSSSASASSVAAPCSTADAQQPARGLRLAALKRGGARVDQLFAFALTFGDRAARALDVRAGACVTAIEEQGPRPDVDGEIVLAGEVVIEAAQEQLFEARFAIVFRIESRGGGERWCGSDVTNSVPGEAAAIMSRTAQHTQGFTISFQLPASSFQLAGTGKQSW